MRTPVLSRSSLRAFLASATAGALLSLAAPVAAVPINVALNKPVTITGEVGIITTIFPDAPTAPLSSLVDGVYLPEGTDWQDGTVWWDERHPGSADNLVEIDLEGLFSISSLSIQADNNDGYRIFVRDGSGLWTLRAEAGTVIGAGMRERAGDFMPFEATAFRIDAIGGDQFYSLSEFQAIGQSIPEPASLLLFAAALAGLGLSRRRKA